MNVIKLKTQTFELEISLDSEGNASICQDGKQVAATASEIDDIRAAVIAMALNEYLSANSADHDAESDVITLVAQPTAWNSKASMMNRLKK